MTTRGDQYQGDLVLGQEVYSGLYGGRNGIIGDIHGQAHPGTIRRIGGGCVVMGGNAEYDVIFDDHINKRIPECIIRGIQWMISDSVESPASVRAAREKAEAEEQKAEIKREEELRQREEVKAALPEKYPYLKADGKSASANIKTELKRAFPGIDFSVKTSRTSVDVNWTDGPTVSEVKKITEKYEEGHFNSMEDIYEYCGANVWPDVFGGARFVSNNRHYTAMRYVTSAAKFGVVLSLEEADVYGVSNLELSSEIRRDLEEQSYMEKK